MKHFYLKRLFLIILAIIGITNLSFGQSWEVVDEYDLTSKEGGTPVLEDPISISKNLGSYSYKQLEGDDFYTLYYLASESEYFSIRYNLGIGQYRFTYKMRNVYPSDSPFTNPVDFFYSYGSEKTITGKDVSLGQDFQEFTYEFNVENEGNYYLGFAPNVPQGTWGGYYISSLKLEKFTEGDGNKYEEPTYTTSEKPFEDYADTYVKNITLTNGSQEKSWTHTERKFWNVLPELTMNATAGETISAHFEAYSLGAYNEDQALQDIRFTNVVLSIDWNGDGTFEFAQLIKGRIPPVHNVGGNAMSSQEELDNSKAQNKPTTFDPDWYVMDYTYDIAIPEDVRTGTARVRFNYTNAWRNRIGNEDETDEQYVQRNINSSKEGIIYDFDIKISEKALSSYTINIEENEHARINVKDGDGRIKDGDKVAEGRELTVEVATDPGYKVSKVMAGDIDITEDLKFTVTKDVTISAVVEGATYVDLAYSVTGEEETFIEKIGFYNDRNELITNKQILKGEKYSIRIYPKDGNKDIEISATLNQNPIELTFDDSEKAFIYEGIAENNQTFVINVPICHIVNIVPNEHATITVKNADQVIESGDKVIEGAQLTVEVTPEKGYKIISVKAGKEDITENLVFTVSENVTVSATVELETGIGSINVSGIYYNPTEQILYTNGAKVIVYDMAGRIVANNTGNISVSDLANGIYTAVVNGISYKFKK